MWFNLNKSSNELPRCVRLKPPTLVKPTLLRARYEAKLFSIVFTAICSLSREVLGLHVHGLQFHKCFSVRLYASKKCVCVHVLATYYYYYIRNLHSTSNVRMYLGSEILAGSYNKKDCLGVKTWF